MSIIGCCHALTKGAKKKGDGGKRCVTRCTCKHHLRNKGCPFRHECNIHALAGKHLIPGSAVHADR